MGGNFHNIHTSIHFHIDSEKVIIIWFDIRHVCELLFFVYLLLASWFAVKTFLSLIFICVVGHPIVDRGVGDIPWERKHD